MNRFIQYSIFLAFFSLFLMTAVPCLGATFYVSTTGRETNAGTIRSPLRHLQYAADKASPGDTIYVRGGVYFEKLILSKSNLTFRAYENELPIIDGKKRIPAGYSPNDSYEALVTINSDGIIFDGFEIRGSDAEGLTINRASNVEVVNCKIHDIYQFGLRFYYSSDSIVDKTEIYDCVQKAVEWGTLPAAAFLVGSKNCTITRSIIRDNHHYGVDSFGKCDGTIIEKCIIFNNKEGQQIYINYSRNCIIRHNLIYDDDAYNAAICFRNESWLGDDSQYSGSHLVYGNLIANTHSGVWISAQPGGLPPSNIKIFNNTFIGTSYAIRINGDIGSGHELRNNIFWNSTIAPTNTTKIAHGRFMSSNNIWSDAPPINLQSNSDPKDIEGNYLSYIGLAKDSGWNQLKWGDLSGKEFSLKADSPACGKGSDLINHLEYLLDLDSTNLISRTYKHVDLSTEIASWDIGADVFLDTDSNSAGNTIPAPSNIIITSF